MYQTKNKRIFGIDPGLGNTGWAFVGRNRSGKFVVLDAGCITTESTETEGKRLHDIHTRLTELLWTRNPDALAIERVFHNRNVSSSLTTAAVIGICQLSAELAGTPSHLFTPQQVKSAIGIPTADKRLMRRGVEGLTGKEIKNHHTADAIAAGITGLAHQRGFAK